MKVYFKSLKMLCSKGENSSTWQHHASLTLNLPSLLLNLLSASCSLPDSKWHIICCKLRTEVCPFKSPRYPQTGLLQVLRIVAHQQCTFTSQDKSHLSLPQPWNCFIFWFFFFFPLPCPSRLLQLNLFSPTVRPVRQKFLQLCSFQPSTQTA